MSLFSSTPDQPLFPEVQPIALADARDYDVNAEPGAFLAVWDPAESSDVAHENRETSFRSFTRVGASAAAAVEATRADLVSECVRPESGSFRLFRVRDGD